jgi:hypothetical protein
MTRARSILEIPQLAPRLLACRLVLILLGPSLLGACAGLGQELHLAPVYTQLSSAGGGVTTEALAGVVRAHRTQAGSFDYLALLPLYSWRRHPNDDRTSWFIPPLGFYKEREEKKRHTTQFLPLFRHDTKQEDVGEDSWSLYVFPFNYFRKDANGKRVTAVFPLFGTYEHFFSFDSGWFFLFPLVTYFQRSGRNAVHALFPIFTWRWGRGGYSWRVWPLAGHNKWEGRYDRWFFLWPFIHRQRNNLALPEHMHESTWAVFPLLGKARRDTHTSYSFLWPFFGYAHDPVKQSWAYDGPWPLVRIIEPGPIHEEEPKRYRFWPFYSMYRGDGLDSRWVMWPLVNWRTEEYKHSSKSAQNVALFWHSWDRKDSRVGDSHYRRAWPLFRRSWSEDEEFLAWPALNPFWRLPVIDEHYAWIWELYQATRNGDRIAERSWLGLWRRERDHDEDRRSFTGLWAKRKFTLAGERVTETSLLFGLLRWRSTEGKGIDWKAPAFPGPGWPLERVPNSILAEGD